MRVLIGCLHQDDWEVEEVDVLLEEDESVDGRHPAVRKPVRAPQVAHHLVVDVRPRRQGDN